MAMKSIDDPVLAVMVSRFDRLERDNSEFRADVKNWMERQEVRSENLEKAHAVSERKFDKISNTARGGYLMLILLGTIVAYALGVFQKLGDILIK